MGEPSILIVHPDRKTQRIVQRILGVTGHRVDIADDLQQGIRLIDHHAPALVVIGDTAIASPHADAFFAAAEARGTVACMTLLGGKGDVTVPNIVGTGAVTNLLVHPMPVLAEELTITAHKLLRGEVFGVEKYLLWGTELRTVALARASQRAAIVEQLAAAIRACGQSARVASMAMLIADELISNAVHNAPIDGAGHRYRKELPRDGELELDDRHRVELRWGCDARYVAIEVRDRFGSLDRDTILRALAASNVRSTGGGAGMGISLAYRSCDHLVFDLAPGRCTEVIALVDVRYPQSERPTSSSYNVFVDKAMP